MNKIFLLFVTLFLSVQAFSQENPLSKAEAAFTDANYALCLQECLAGIDQSSGDSILVSQFYAYAGLSSEELSEATSAIAYYKQSMDYKVPRLDIYTKMANLTKTEGDHINYEYALNCQAKEFPDFTEDVLVKLNSHYYKTKQYDQLEKNAEKYLSIWPDDVKSNYYLAYAKQKQNKISEAKTLYRKVVSLDENH